MKWLLFIVSYPEPLESPQYSVLISSFLISTVPKLGDLWSSENLLKGNISRINQGINSDAPRNLKKSRW